MAFAARTLAAASPVEQARLTSALDRFAAAAALEAMAGRQGSAAKALGPIAIAVAGALGGGAESAAAVIERAATRLEAGQTPAPA